MRRQRAHDVVYEVAQAAFTGNCPFRELLVEDAQVRAKLTPDVTELLDPSRYTGLCRQSAEEVALQARNTAQPAPGRAHCAGHVALKGAAP